MTKKRKDSDGRVLKEGEGQRKDGRYIYRRTNDLGKRQTVYANSLSELREKERAIQNDISDGIDYVAGRITLEQLLQITIAQKRNIKRSTQKVYDTKYNVVCRHSIARKPVCNIKPTDVKAFLIELYERGRKFGTIYTYYVILKEAFKVAVADDLIRKNPVNFGLQNVIRNDTKERRGLTREEKDSFLAFLQTDSFGRKYYDVVVILLETGIRISELCGLTKSDVDFSKREISITKQLLYNVNRRYSIAPPKSKAGIRVIPMSNKAQEALCRVLKNRKSGKVEYIVDGIAGFIFLTTQGTPKTADNFDYVFRRLTKKYNSKHANQLPDITPHVLRHTFCTDMVNYGMNPKHLQYLMGHSRIEMTLNVYTHVNQDVVRDAFYQITDAQQ